MIIGYYSVEFNGNLRIRDYQGCVYPEGLLLPDQVCTFNHTDIEKVDFLGYKDDEQYKFQRLLDRLTGNTNDVENAKTFHEENDMVLTSSKSYSKLLFDENGVVVLAEPVLESPKSNVDIKFDKDGYVISNETDSDINNPFYKEYTTTEPKIEDSDNWNIFNKVEFDENGVVISAEEKIEPSKENLLNKIEFDENGVVISVGNDSPVSNEESNANEYKFDENGVLISVGNDSPVSNE